MRSTNSGSMLLRFEALLQHSSSMFKIHDRGSGSWIVVHSCLVLSVEMHDNAPLSAKSRIGRCTKLIATIFWLQSKSTISSEEVKWK